MEPNLLSQINLNGYIVFRKLVDPSYALKCIDEKVVNYSCMTDFIENAMLKSVDDILGWKMEYTKFRISDNNNSADASGFHRDFFPLPPYQDPIPCFTCLTYLDKTVMEVIPRSHKKFSMSYLEALMEFKNSVRLNLEPGDVLLFYSTLLHRGIFTEKIQHRRLIQVFEVYRSPSDYHLYNNQFLHIPGNETYSDLMIKLSKMHVVSSFINFLGYLNASTGYGSQRMGCVPDDIKYMSSEGLRERIQVIPDTWQEINKYILKHSTRDLPLECYKGFHYTYYRKQFIIYTITLITIFIIIIYSLYYLFTKTKTPKPKRDSKTYKLNKLRK